MADEHGGESVYFRPLRPVAREHPDWKIRVNAPRLLQKLFSEILDGREHYRKTTHSIRLTEWLLENCPEALEGVAAYLGSILKAEVPNN
jgi:hypothetical protein